MSDLKPGFKKHAEQDLINSFDPEKFLYVLRSRWWILLLLFAVSLTVAYLFFIRWTKPVFESESILKLEFESEAASLGLGTDIEAIKLNELSGEIELLRSNLFFSRVAEVVGMDVSYYYYGTYLTDERYRNSPFVVSYKVRDASFYDFPFDVWIRDANTFELIYTCQGKEHRSTHRFGEEIRREGFNFLIEKTTYFKGENVEGRYYFVIYSREALIHYFQQHVSVRPENFNAKTIRISLQDFNKIKARDLVMAIDTLYLAYTKEAKNQALEQKIRFLENQISVTENKLEEFENYFETFTIRNRTTDLKTDLARTIGQLDLLDSQRLHLKTRLSNVELLENQLRSDSPLILNPVVRSQFPDLINTTIGEFQKIRNDRSEKLGAYNENTYVIRQLDKSLSTIKADLVELVSEYRSGLEKSIAENQLRRRQLESNFVELPSMGTEYNKNSRLYELQEDFLLALRQSKMELEITKAGTVPKSVILSPASLPDAPIRPRKLLIMGVGFSVALAVSLVFVLVSYLLHNKITSLRELEKLISVPVLGSIPFYRKEKLLNTKFVIGHDSRSAISEALRTIRTNMEFLKATEENRVISITSTVSGEGKTFIAVNLGGIVALSNQKVCVVDLDMRKPKVNLAFGDDQGHMGVSTLLIGKNSLKEVIRSTEIANLDYIPAGPTPPNPSELILHKEYDRLIAKLRDKYDMIILDTPPAGLVTDAVQSMKKSDLQIYVMRADYSKRSFVRSIENLREINQFTNLTVIFNSVNSGSRGYGYGYGYGHEYYE